MEFVRSKGDIKKGDANVNVNVKCGFSYDGKDKVAVVVAWWDG